MNQFKKDIIINPHDINKALLEQPQLYYEYAKLAAIAKNDLEDAKDNLDIVKEEIEAIIRNKKSDEYRTDKAIKNAVEIHPKVKRYRQKYMKARKLSKLADKAEKSFEQRKSMLQSFVYYNVNNMNSDVKIPTQIKREINKDISQDIKNQLKSTIRIKRR